MEKMKLEVRSRDEIRDHESGAVKPFSSAYSYDSALSSIFPYFIQATVEEARELSGVLERGYRSKGFSPTSYAIVVDLGAEKNRVIWLSTTSLMTLQQHPDLYELEVKSPFTILPAHN